ncbi:hypothetical protein [Flavobacterium covae]|uniref:hypothetical protein n=1 Tax=Flavobacterium covae TaxID=2906076 RepID=UPI000B232A44|nr:hypothetical protein [Flavobacterium covae]MCJ1810204.1 hypothetical protein [Flavobacterium covae]
MKKIYFYVIALWSLFFVTSGFTQCTFSELAKDFSRNRTLKDFVKSDPKAFDAWYLLNKEKPSLRNSLSEVKIVAENFQEVKNAGGYQKWIDKLSSEERNVPIPFLDSQQKFEQTVDVSNLPKHLRSLAYQYYKKANNENKLHLWQRLEEIFKEYKINGNWPPYNGGYNIESGVSLQKYKKYDRFANPIGNWDGVGEPLLGGNFTSPIINDQPFDFSSRALNIPESNYTFYYEIEILEDLGFDGELADVIPWFGYKGQGKQMKWNIPKDPATGRPKTWNKLAEEGKVKITIKDIPNGNAELIRKWKGYVIGKDVVDGIVITSKETQYLQRFKSKFTSLSDMDFIRAYRRIENAGFDVRGLLQKTQINDDIVRLEKMISYAKNDVQKINNLFDKNLLSGGYNQFIELVDIYLLAFKKIPVSNVKPNYFTQANRIFDDINMKHIMDKHSAECFDFNVNGISNDIDMFPIGTTQQQVSAYIDEALTILKNTKGANYPLNGNAELVKLSNGMEVFIGSNLGVKLLNAPGVFPNNANIIGQFYPKAGTGGITIKSSILKIINELQ